MFNLFSLPFASITNIKARSFIACRQLVLFIFGLFLALTTLSPVAASDLINDLQQTEAKEEPIEHAPSSMDLCWNSFNRTRQQVVNNHLQSVIMLTDSKGLAPYVSLHQSNEKGESYNLWQTLNGNIRGYATKDGQGFDYATNLTKVSPLTWHPTFIWDTLFASNKPLRNYSCVMTGRTRIMGKRVTLLRLFPQEGLRYAYIIAKEDESDFPVELTVNDNRGVSVMRMTVIESRIIAGSDFPINDEAFAQNHTHPKDNKDLSNIQNTTNHSPNNLNRGLTATQQTQPEHNSSNVSTVQNSNSLTSGNISDLTRPTPSASMTGSKQQTNLFNEDLFNITIWPELNIPQEFDLIAEEKYPQVSDMCSYQEYSDGITTFRVYKDKASTMHFKLLNNVTLTVLRKSNLKYEYTIVGEIPLGLAEFVLSKINSR